MLDVKVDQLKETMSKRHITGDAIASAIGINRSTFYRKLNEGGTRFTAEEIFRMKDYIPLSDAEVIQIFLQPKSHKRDKEPQPA
ncbi:XRE family transcriptional regulator [Lacticaseibacillus hulanensis]|uniref:XRE family transcriptional regulator n=1 Tax=Lacticaseibacillus hulanensis TaxID=2493111 RepID=UPI0019D4791F|nr:XRE family transcriptional regulator [Lacticaseibacillus hulanensis]